MADRDTPAAPTALMHPLFGDAKQSWGWLVGFGVLSVLLGTIGLGMTPFLTLAGVTFFGILLAVGGTFQLVDAFKCKGWKGTVVNVLIGLIYVAAGLVIAIDPLRAAVVLTLLLGIVVIAAGVLRIVVAFQHKGTPGWLWALVGGIVSILLGFVVLSGWPVSGVWVIGLVIAVELIVNGWTYIFVGLAARRIGRGQDTAKVGRGPHAGMGSGSNA